MTSLKEEAVRLHDLEESACVWKDRFRSELTVGEKVDFRQITWGRIQLYDIFSPRDLYTSIVLILSGIDSPFLFFFSWIIILLISVHSLSRERAISYRRELELAHISALFSLGSCKVEATRADRLRGCVCAGFNSLPSIDPFVTSLNKELVNHHLPSMGAMVTLCQRRLG